MKNQLGIIIILIGLTAGIADISAAPVRIVSYNVENLFYPKHDSVWVDSTWVETDDWEWTPEGARRWNFTRYNRKIENIARVLTNIGEWDGVDIVGLQEIENARCTQRLCRTLRLNEYDYVHFESPDRRGIDVALIYRKMRIDTICTRAIPVVLDGRQTTRDILYAGVTVDKRDTLHLFVCHLPSQRGGAAESEWKRRAAKEVLQTAVDSVLAIAPQAKIVVMGDMNSAPAEDIAGLRNRMMQSTGNTSSVINHSGTHKHQGKWTCLDQFYTSPALDSLTDVRIYDAEWIQEPDEKYLEMKPKRTYNGFQYQEGFSDHLPIVLEAAFR